MAEMFLRRCRAVIRECERLMSTDNLNDETTRFVIGRLQHMKRAIQRSAGNLISVEMAQDLVKGAEETVAAVQCATESGDQPGGTSYRAPRASGYRGAPKFVISREQLQFFIDCGFTIPQMAEILQVSKRTINRRVKEFELKIASFSDMSDMQLDEMTSHIVHGNTRIGPNAVRARLFSIGHKIQRQRVRDSMLRIDPQGAAERAMRPNLQRRSYRVAGPNSLWHIDGNHKLIRWKIVIHGGIDGFSRLFVFLHAADNNRSQTVLTSFTEAAATYGIPSRVRCDLGGENNDVCMLMEVVRGGGRGSALRGTSTHNQRIERSWVDLWCGVTNMYYDLFSFLEAEGNLNVDNAVHIWALHYVYLPRINEDLRLFMGQWNNHGLRTEGSRSPLQLFVQHVLRLQGGNLTAIQDIFSEPAHQALAPPEGLDLDNLVEVPPIQCPVTENQLEQLRELVEPLDGSDPLGMSLYTRTLSFINNL